MTEIRQATKIDFAKVSDWLKCEKSQSNEGFFCNINIIDLAFQEGEMIVLIADGEPLAFASYGLTRSGIMETHPDHRNKGYGTKLVEYMMQCEIEKDSCLLDIQCAPETSVSFWEKCGFRIYENSLPGKYAYRTLEKTLSPSPHTVPVIVSINFYSCTEKHSENGCPFSEHSPQAHQDKSGKIYLSERVIYNHYVFSKGGQEDGFAEVIVNGNVIYFNKVKYQDAKSIGFQCDDHGEMYIDIINLLSTLQRPL